MKYFCIGEALTQKILFPLFPTYTHFIPLLFCLQGFLWVFIHISSILKKQTVLLTKWHFSLSLHLLNIQPNATEESERHSHGTNQIFGKIHHPHAARKAGR
jgi:hypothetical protein